VRVRRTTIGAGGDPGSLVAQGRDHKKIEITGYGAQARVRAMILEELMKGEYGKSQTGAFDPNKPDGDYLHGLELKYVDPTRGSGKRAILGPCASLSLPPEGGVAT